MFNFRKIAAFLFCLMVPLSLFAQNDIVVTSEAGEYAVAGKPINGSVTVTHEKNQKIDEKSFKLGEDPIPLEFIKEVKISPDSDLIISIYQFTIPPKRPGRYVLPPVTVTVGGKQYTSLESIFDVNSGLPR
jgi:hypothetical protein